MTTEPPGRSAQPVVRLVAVDEEVLARLVLAATTDASADEVTPPLDRSAGWTPARVAWLEDYHRARRSGVDGPTAESTWAVEHDGQVVGAVRLRRSGPGELETGMWLVRSARGRGLGRAALAELVRLAEATGAAVLRAVTTAGNAPALAALQGLGFALSPGAEGGDALVARRALGVD